MTKIAVIGGGISAFLLAYRLRGLGASLEIFEAKSEIGGNCHTCDVDVGQFPRWTDLAVNDFNAPMYGPVVAAMDDLGVPYAPLEDTASFYTSDGSVAYTLDGGWGTPPPNDFAALYAVFAARAYDVMTSTQYRGMTVEQFLKEPPFAAVPEFGAQCILPRVNAMYFCAPGSAGGPASMPIQTAYLYYYFQEGFGTGNYASPNGGRGLVDRQYFLQGAGSFTAALQKKAIETGTSVRTGAPAVVSGTPNNWFVTQGTTKYGPYAQIVFACHANDALAAFSTAPPDVRAMLGKVHYAPSIAYAHLDESLLPPKRARRTYNVLIRQGTEHRDYAMTYVINEHQADRESSLNAYFDCPEFYVSLNPQRKPNAILNDRSRGGAPCIVEFDHNVGDLSLGEAQRTLANSGIQGKDGVFFIGGWTTGAGLMIECWKSIDPVLAMLHGHADVPDASYDESRAPHLFAPKYIRDARPPRTVPLLNRLRGA